MSNPSNEITVNLDDLDTDTARNARADYGDISEFKSRIRAFGLRGRIQVRKNPGEGKPYLLEDGFRRITTILELLDDGITHSDDGQDLSVIQAQVLDLDERARTELLLALNTSGKTWTPYEQAQQLKVLLDNGVTEKELESKLGLKSLAIQQRLALLEAPKFLQDALSEGKLTASAARAILRIPNEELQAKLTADAIEGDFATRAIEHRAEQLVDEAVAAGAPAPRRRAKKEDVPVTEVDVDSAEGETTTTPDEDVIQPAAEKAPKVKAEKAPTSTMKSEADILEELKAFQEELKVTTDPVTKAEIGGYISALEWVLNREVAG